MKRIVRRSVDDEVTRLVMKDAPLFVGAILAIVGWLALTFGSMNKVESRFLITWVVLLEMGFCMVFGFGWLGYNRLWSTTNTYVLSSLNAMIPFVIAGVSVDDMIVIEDFYNKCEGKEERLRETMKVRASGACERSVRAERASGACERSVRAERASGAC
jgi:hypothetical protein